MNYCNEIIELCHHYRHHLKLLKFRIKATPKEHCTAILKDIFRATTSDIFETWNSSRVLFGRSKFLCQIFIHQFQNIWFWL